MVDLQCQCRSHKGHIRVDVGHPMVTIGHRHLRVTIVFVYLMVTKGHPRVTTRAGKT